MMRVSHEPSGAGVALALGPGCRAEQPAINKKSATQSASAKRLFN
jgi:hypothetical protein